MEATRFHTSEKIGANTGRTAEGFLVCYNVPIARTGTLLYGPNERPEVPPGPDGLVRIERDPKDVFEPESVATLQGKPLVNGHPDDVNPNNWKELAKGTVHNPRRGEGAYDDCVVADITVMDAEAIADVLAGKREVSAGYDAKYWVIKPGYGRQTNIRFNHVALVESGRCGPRCSIKDHAMKGAPRMAKWIDKMRTAFSSQDQRTFDEALEEAEKETKDSEAALEEEKKATKDSNMEKRLTELEEGHAEHKATTADHTAKLASHSKIISTHDNAIKELKGEKEAESDTKEEREDKEIESELKQEAPPGTGDHAMRAKDSAYLVDSFRHTVSIAEIIAPGIKLLTFDGKSSPKDTYRNICAFRKRALTLGLLNPTTNAVIEEVRGGRTLDAAGASALTCAEVRGLFFAVGTAMKAANTRDNNKPGIYTNVEGTGGGLGVAGRVKTPAEINKINAARFGGK